MISPPVVRQGVSFVLEDLARTGTDKQLELALVDFKAIDKAVVVSTFGVEN